jgi:hypothetical protein
VTLPVLNRRNRSKELPTETSESVSDNWVRGLRSIRENPKDSLRGDQREELTLHRKMIPEVSLTTNVGWMTEEKAEK